MLEFFECNLLCIGTRSNKWTVYIHNGTICTQPIQIHIGAEFWVVVHAHDRRPTPLESPLALVLVGQCELILATKPPLVIVPELESARQVVKHRVIAIVVNFI